LDSDLETAFVQCVDQWPIELQQRLPAPAPSKKRWRAFWPVGGNAVAEGLGIRVAASVAAVGADKVGIAKGADRAGAVGLAPDHKLQPANRQKTDGRPVWAPSPCSV